MTQKNYTVRCNPSSSASYKTTIWETINGKEVEVKGPIVVRSSTDFVLTADYGPSDASVKDFKIDVTAYPPPDIQNLSGRKNSTITFTDVCKTPGDISMNLAAYVNGVDYVTGGKPIIRNGPSRVVFVVLAVAVALAVLGVAYYFYTR